MLKEVAIKYYQDGYNCAESIIHAGNEYYDLKLSDHAMRMTAAFGGGLQIGDICGALAGAACVLSCKYVEHKAHDDKEMLRHHTQKLVLAFQKRLGSRVCAKIKPVYHSDELRCQKTVELAAEVLEEVMSEIDGNNKEV